MDAAKAYRKADEEVEQIRQSLQERYSRATKPPLEEVVEEKGYAGEVVEERPLPPPVPIVEDPARPVEYHAPEKSKDTGWVWKDELASRNKHFPYVIHQDEFNAEEPHYTQVSWTYWAADNILTDERTELVSRPDLVVGLEHIIGKFGHGSDDDNVMFVRNDRLEMEFEICRSFQSYEEEVLGHDGPHDETESEPD